MGNEIHSNNAANEKDGNWLMAYAKNITSQFGENGIIAKVLEILGEGDKWCVEFGSWDGKTCSNTYDLITEKGYRAVLVECSKKRYKDLLKTFEGNDRTIKLNEFVGFDSDNNLDSILKKTDVPVNFDLLSIDIDGCDYHVWDAVKGYKPKVVVIEFNPTIPKTIEFIQPKDLHVTQGSSLLSTTKLAREKGYELIATTRTNGIYVDAKYFPKFGIKDNSVAKMMTDESFITHIFAGYDGTLFLRGKMVLPWQAIPLEESRIQHLPKWARKVVGDRNFIRRKFGKFYRKLCRKGRKVHQLNNPEYKKQIIKSLV